MTEPAKAISIYRFNDLVCVNPDGHRALYIEPDFARTLATLLEVYAENIETCKFTKSTLKRATIDRKIRPPMKQEKRT